MYDDINIIDSSISNVITSDNINNITINGLHITGQYCLDKQKNIAPNSIELALLSKQFQKTRDLNIEFDIDRHALQIDENIIIDRHYDEFDINVVINRKQEEKKQWHQVDFAVRNALKAIFKLFDESHLGPYLIYDSMNVILSIAYSSLKNKIFAFNTKLNIILEVNPRLGYKTYYDEKHGDYFPLYETELNSSGLSAIKNYKDLCNANRLEYFIAPLVLNYFLHYRHQEAFNFEEYFNFEMWKFDETISSFYENISINNEDIPF